jgi:hypothetical protein
MGILRPAAINKDLDLIAAFAFIYVGFKLIAVHYEYPVDISV